MKKLMLFIKREIVLSIAIVLAAVSAIWVHPDAQYREYIDFRTLAVLFCLMTVVAGFRKLGFFDLLAEKLLARTKTVAGVAFVLVFLCFFLPMVITNDVALITFVPFTITIMHKMEEKLRRKWMLRVIVMQTLAANLGSMFTPIGNPQNLYLFGMSDDTVFVFLRLMFPYTLVSGILLAGWIILCAAGSGKNHEKTEIKITEKTDRKRHFDMGKYAVCATLLFISLLAVGRILPYEIPLGCVLIYTLLCERSLLKEVDYSLLGTFAALFIFIGNLGRMQGVHDLLQQMVNGREVLTAIVASQFMSNVPAAILLSGFTDQIKALIIGTDLGGLGTLIASMASLISFKYAAREKEIKTGRYIVVFTIANIVFLLVLLGLYWAISQTA